MRTVPYLFGSILLTILAFFLAPKEPEKIDTIFGKETIDHPLIKEIILSPAMRRLVSIDQSGVPYYYGYVPRFSRYSHSVGVYALLKRFGAPFEEQVSGLLHDASHTVFSHLGDILFNMKTQEDAYQDTIHDWYLHKMDISPMLQPHGLDLSKIHPKNENFRALEQNLPDMCADRIEYNLHTAYVFGMMNQEEINHILSNLRFEEGRWFFVSSSSAKQFANLSLQFTEHFWGSSWNYMLNYWFGRAVSKAVGLGIISIDEIHFETDSYILSKLHKSKDKEIQDLLTKCENVLDTFKESEEKYDILLKPKFRGINPLVYIHDTFHRLTDLDSSFRKEYERVKNLVKKGIKIQLLVHEKDPQKEFLPTKCP